MTKQQKPRSGVGGDEHHRVEEGSSPAGGTEEVHKCNLSTLWANTNHAVGELRTMRRNKGVRSGFLSYGKEEEKSQAPKLRQEDCLRPDQFRLDREYQANQDYIQDLCVCFFLKSNFCNLGGWETFLRLQIQNINADESIKLDKIQTIVMVKPNLIQPNQKLINKG